MCFIFHILLIALANRLLLATLQGGFIWDWVDQALLKTETLPDGRTLEYWAYGGDYGDSPNDAQARAQHAPPSRHLEGRSVVPAALPICSATGGANS